MIGRTPRGWVLGPGAVYAGRDILAPVTTIVVNGAYDRVRDAIFDPAPLVATLDLARFTGREWLLRQIDEALAALTKGYIVVRGEAGVGKTALMAHLAMTRPCVHHFTRVEGGRSPIAARHSIGAQLIGWWRLEERFAEHDLLPASADRPDWLLKVLHAAAARRDQQRADEPLILVVDGLDEADPPEPGGDTGIPLGLPRPEHLPDGVFIVSASRFGRPLAALHAGASWHTIAIAGAENLADIHSYVDRVLDEPDSSLAAVVRAAGLGRERFTETLIGRCGGLWIYLRYVLDAIRLGEQSPAELDDLPAGLAEYYLRQVERWQASLSWYGVGLPLLATLAALRRPVTRPEAARFAAVEDGGELWTWLNQALRPFLDAATGEDRATFQVRHETLRELFRLPDPSGADPDNALPQLLRDSYCEAHRRIAGQLTPPEVGGDRDWSRADAYTRTALPEHLALCGRLDELMLDAGFLLAVNASAVQPWRTALTTRAARRAFAGLELSLDNRLGDRPQDRARWLHACARRVRADELAASAARRFVSAWTIGRAWWTGDGHQPMPGRASSTISVAIGQLDDLDVVVAGGEDGWVRVWDPQRTALPTELYRHESPVMAVAIGRVAGRTVIASSSGRSGLRLWDSAAPAEPLILGGASGWAGSVAIAEVAGLDLVVHASREGIGFWDVRARRRLPDLPCAEAVTAVAAGRWEGRDIVAAAGRDLAVRIWDWSTRELLAAFTGHLGTGITGNGEIFALAVGRVGDDDVIVSGGDDGTVRLWHPDGEREPQVLRVFERETRAATIRRVDGRDLVIAAGQRRSRDRLAGTVVAWDPLADAETVQDLVEYGSDTMDSFIRVWAAAAGRVGRRTVVASAGDDRTVRLRTLVGTDEPAPRWGRADGYFGLALGRIDDADVIVAGGGRGDIHLLDPAGERDVVVLSGHTDYIHSVAVGTAYGQPVVVSADRRSVRIWPAGDAADGVVIDVPDDGDVVADRHVDVAVGSFGGTGLIIAATNDGVFVLDLQGKTLAAEPLPGPKRMTTGHLFGRDIVAVATTTGIIVWDPLDDARAEFIYDRIGRLGGLTLGRFGSRDVFAVVADDGVQLFDPVEAKQVLAFDGETMLSSLTRQRVDVSGGFKVWSAALGLADGRSVLLTSGTGSAVLAWELTPDEGIVMSQLGSHPQPIDEVIAGRVGGQDVVIGAYEGGTLMLWTPRPRPPGPVTQRG
ncbi:MULTISPECIES: AAA family ATPase [Micromonospora]|uniref:AAA family ATPase n=1 Tax=Micromonospora TaxID=1873 RepID=UPI000828A2A0|nr:AAA family ATPase [Micromonospora aurantiaca]SCL29897.1 WD-40 repeat-containing protein [Micromonospora aurantiaca]